MITEHNKLDADNNALNIFLNLGYNEKEYQKAYNQIFKTDIKIIYDDSVDKPFVDSKNNVIIIPKTKKKQK